MIPSGEPVLVACSVFRPELEALARARWPGLDVRFVSSMLHMRPLRLEQRLRAEVGEARRAAHPVALVYGDCCAGMSDLAAGPGVARVGLLNCPATLLGGETYRRLSHEGAFFLLPEWTARWQEVFQVELGLDAAIARDFMGDMHRKLVYLDTGVTPVPGPTLEACSRFTGLPCEVFPVSLARLAELVEAALERLAREAG